MSFGRSFGVATLSVLAGLVVNILTDPANRLAERLGIPLLPLLLAALLVIIVFSAILQALPPPTDNVPAQLLIQLEQHRKALRQLKERCVSGQGWTASCVEKWEEHQRSIAALKKALNDLRIPIKDDQIDTEPVPNVGCGLRLALLMKHTAALLLVPLAFFGVGYAGTQMLRTSYLASPLIARVTATLPHAGPISPEPVTATAQQTAPSVVVATATAQAGLVRATMTPMASPAPSPTPTLRSTPGTTAPSPTSFPSVVAPPPPSTRPSPPPSATVLPPTGVPATSLPAGCVEGRRITRPRSGEVLARGIIQVQGSASFEPFQRYKIEVAPGDNPRDNDFIWLFESSSPVMDGVLAEWDARAVTPGVYSLRLTVVKPDGNWYEPRCLVTFTLQ